MKVAGLLEHDTVTRLKTSDKMTGRSGGHTRDSLIYGLRTFKITNGKTLYNCSKNDNAKIDE